MADNGEPRVVISYNGLQIVDARDTILFVVCGAVPKAAQSKLKSHGFRRRSSNSWEAPANPQNYMAARVIGRTFFQSDEQ